MVGADLWHMNNYAGPSMALKVPEYKTTFSMTPLHFGHEQPGGMIIVGPDASRFCNEKLRAMHGKIKKHGKWIPHPVPCPMHMVFDHAVFSSGPLYDKKPVSGWGRIVERYDWSDDNVAELKRGWIKRAETIADLAKLIGLDPRALEETVSRWNTHSAGGKDPSSAAPRCSPRSVPVPTTQSNSCPRCSIRKAARAQREGTDRASERRTDSAALQRRRARLHLQLHVPGHRQHRRMLRIRSHLRSQRGGRNALDTR